MKTIIAGSRDIEDYELFKTAVVMAQEMVGILPTEVVSGCQKGVDLMAIRWAEEMGLSVCKFPAEWEQHGKAAGPIRNSQMANYGDALIAIMFKNSKGTSDMIRKSISKGLRVFVMEVRLGNTRLEPEKVWQVNCD